VCVDAAYYTFPSPQYLEGMANQVPKDFLFGFKVTDAITLKRFPNLDRFGDLAEKANENFLNAELFVKSFPQPCESVRSQVGLLMFEFSRFYSTDYQRDRDFVADLDRFLEQLPKGWPYGVELRNRDWLRPDYFQCLPSTRSRTCSILGRRCRWLASRWRSRAAEPFLTWSPPGSFSSLAGNTSKR
jgi:uncharacterized protein YecE (DUF72 family)